MTLNEMIYHRKSCRSFLGQPVDSETIEKILSFEMKPLYHAPATPTTSDASTACAVLQVAP